MRSAGILLLLAFTGFSIYSNTFNVPFHYDDYTWIVGNDIVHINRLTPDGILRVFTDSYNRPVAMISFAANYYASGLEVYGFHLLNVSIHILTAFGLFAFLNLAFSLLFPWPEDKRHLASLAASLLWLANPIQTQAVTYIVQRMTGMAAMFYIYSIFFYLKGRVSRGKKRGAYLALCGIFALLAFGTKQSTFLLPLFFFLCEVCIVRRGDTGIIRERRFYIPFLVMAALFFILTAILYPEQFNALFSPYPGMGYIIKERLFTQARVFFSYISIFFFPFPSRLNIMHNPDLSKGLFDPPATAFAVAAILLIAGYAVFKIRKAPLRSFFIFWLLGNLAIEAFHVSLAAMYEHRMYLPGMGIAAIAGMGTSELLCRGRRWRFILPILVLLSFSANTYIRNSVWKDHVSLWSDAAKKAPYSVEALAGFGISLLNEKRIDESIMALQKAKGINPREPFVRYYLGVAFYEYKEYDKAIDEFRSVWRMGLDSPAGQPTIDGYFVKMARSFLAHGNVEKGRELLLEAGRFHPDNPEAKDMLKKLESGKLTAEDLRPEGW